MKEQTSPINQFSAKTKEVISFSREEALKLGNDFIGTEHLVLGILRHKHNIGAKILKHSINKFDLLKNELENSVKGLTANNSESISLPLTKQAEKTIRVSLLEAKDHNAEMVDTACLLLSVLRLKETNACNIIEKHGLDHSKASSLYLQIQDSEKVINKSTRQASTQESIPDTEVKSQVEQLLERVIQVSMRDSIDGVLDIENESSEIATLLTSLSLDQGMMFGLFGKWGRGKTFFWKNIWKNLATNASLPFHKVEFHAWKYQDTPATWAYLYEVLVKEFYNKPKRALSFGWIGYCFRILRLNFNRKGFTPIIKFFLIVGIGIIAFFLIKELGQSQSTTTKLIAKYIGLPTSLLLTLYNVILFLKKEYSTLAKDVFIKYSEKNSFRQHLGIQAEIQKELSILLKVWIPKAKVGKKRVLIFIDDIDRCNETKIIEIIDSLRIMLDEYEIAKRCVVLAAIDERILKIAISTKYYELVEKDFTEEGEKKLHLQALVREYMDKLFIGGFRLKTLNQTEKKEILKSLTKGKIHSVNRESKKDITESYNSDKQLNGENLIAQDQLANVSFKENVGSDAEVYELEDFEYKYLQEVLEACGTITPRVIRIFYYRYLLAKRFLFLKTSQRPQLYQKWNNTNIDKSILPYLIMFFTANATPEEINTSYFHWISKSERNSNTNEIQFTLLNKSFSIDEDLLKEILQIIEIIVPY